jgi:hypothetical protein
MSHFADLKTRIKALIDADPYFNDPNPALKIPVLAEIAGDVANKIQQQMQKVGVGVFVLLRTVDFPDNQSIDISLDLQFAILVSENTIINRGTTGTGKDADTIVEKLIPLVHWKPIAVGQEHPRPSRFVLDKKAIRGIPPPNDQLTLIGWDVSVNTNVNLN